MSGDLEELKRKLDAISEMAPLHQSGWAPDTEQHVGERLKTKTGLKRKFDNSSNSEQVCPI